MPIRVLPAELAAKIAAGEVVERPVSVAKELLENAIDAGAQEIAIDIAQGGRRLLRVRDDGCGILADEVPLAFERHATSKIASADDLFALSTLGFRGEALASIAAVSRLTLTTRAPNEALGTQVELQGGAIERRQPVARPPGTTVQVEDLFFNTPARLKFLRTDATEAGHIVRLSSSYAIAYSERRFRVRNNDRDVLSTTGTGNLQDALLTIYGLQLAEDTIPVTAEEGPARVWGRVGLPSVQRSNSHDILFYVNQRWIQDRSLSYAVREAYRSLLPQNRYPLAVLFIAVPPQDVDVNIHPTKQEVRFRHSRGVFSLVQRAVRTALMGHHHVPVVTPSPTNNARTGIPSATGANQPGLEFAAWRPPLGRGTAASVSAMLQRTEEDKERLPMLRVVGQIAQTYVVAEGPGGMYLVDQHAAHERIVYEALSRSQEGEKMHTQELLEPMPIELTPQQATLLEDHLAVLIVLGLDVIPFGGSTFLVKAVPASLAGADVGAAVQEIVEAASHGENTTFSWEDQALISLSCHSAVRGGQTLSLDEMRDLVRQLERCDLPHSCPHGRPTILHMSRAELEHAFSRR